MDRRNLDGAFRDQIRQPIEQRSAQPIKKEEGKNKACGIRLSKFHVYISHSLDIPKCFLPIPTIDLCNSLLLTQKNIRSTPPERSSTFRPNSTMPVYCPFRKAEGNAEDLLYMRMRGSFIRRPGASVFVRYNDGLVSQIGAHGLWAQALGRVFMTEAERASQPIESPISHRDPQRIQDMLRIIEQQCSRLASSGKSMSPFSLIDPFGC
jgi:hypothetical protein